jgi:hypothetical protein
VKPTDRVSVADSWTPDGASRLVATPYEVVAAELAGVKVLAWAGENAPLITRHGVGAGAVIVTLCPRMLGQDERAHPALPYLMNGITAGLSPLEVVLPNGARPTGEIMHQLNRTKDGWLVILVNNRGIDKTQHGVARVDRQQYMDVVLRTGLSPKSAKEYTEPRDLSIAKNGNRCEIPLRVHSGDVQVVHLLTR